MLHVKYKMCVSHLVMFWVWLPVNRLLVVKFLGSQKLYPGFLLRGISVLNLSHVVQGSAV